jgi:hypothetical protein
VPARRTSQPLERDPEPGKHIRTVEDVAGSLHSQKRPITRHWERRPALHPILLPGPVRAAAPAAAGAAPAVSVLRAGGCPGGAVGHRRCAGCSPCGGRSRLSRLRMSSGWRGGRGLRPGGLASGPDLSRLATNRGEDDAPKRPIHVEDGRGPNEPCPCGSGNKYKKCLRR